jgi:hypothetical protein
MRMTFSIKGCEGRRKLQYPEEKWAKPGFHLYINLILGIAGARDVAPALH